MGSDLYMTFEQAKILGAFWHHGIDISCRFARLSGDQSLVLRNLETLGRQHGK